jgi:hypothetical protein
MAEWNPILPSAWARALGLVSVPMFGRLREEENPGTHAVLLDGSRTSFSLTIDDAGRWVDSPDPLNWSWSSNLNHSLVIDPHANRLVVRRWDRPDDMHSLPIPDAIDAAKIIETFPIDPPARASTVVGKMTELFRIVRHNVENLRGKEVDLIRIFNALLVWADASFRGKIDEAEKRGPTTLFPVLEILHRRGLIDFGPADVSDAVQNLPIGDLIDGLLSRDRITNLLLDPDLFIRHATGVVYQEAHIELTRRPFGPDEHEYVQQRLFDNFSLEATRPSGQPQRDAHFTPPSLARALAQEAIREMRSMRRLPSQIKVLDPASGSGVFLTETLREFFEIPDAAGSRLSLRGMDKSEISCIMTTFCLQRTALDASLLSPETEVLHRNSLDIKSWGSPDLILMNPPFISWEAMDGEDRATVKRVLGSFYSGRPDASFAFILKAISSLKVGSVLATVVPAPFLESKASEKLREYIRDNLSLSVRLIGRFRGFKYFLGATVEPGLLIITRNHGHTFTHTRNKNIRIILANEGSEDPAIRALRKEPTEPISENGWELYRADLSSLPTTGWLPRSLSSSRFIREISEAGVPQVKDLFDVRLGIRTGANQAFLVSGEDFQSLAPSQEEQEFFRPVADEILSAGILTSRYVFYPYGPNGRPLIPDEDTLARALPTYYQRRLLPVRQDLLNRRSRRSAHWWELSEPRLSWLPYKKPKLVTPSFGRSGNFAYDASGEYAVVQGNAWFWKGGRFDDTGLPWAYVAILNSRLFELILDYFCPRVQGGQYELYWKYTQHVLMPDLSNRDRVGAETLEILEKTGRAITALETPNWESLDKATAKGYGFPLWRMRIALAPESTKAIEETFFNVAEQWKSETAPYSSIRRKKQHPLYRQIVEIGEAAVPLILADLNRKPSHLFWALGEITGESPAENSNARNFLDVVKAWLKWGRAEGYDL